MTPIDNAIADLELPKEGADFRVTQIADRHGVNRSTLSKRWRGLTGSQSDGYAQQQLLNPKQEDELARYIEDLTAKLLPPTRQMIRNFSSEISCIYVGKAWVLCFLHRHHNMLTTKWSTAMDSNRHAADSYNKYKLYFEVLHARFQSTMYCLITHTIWMKKAS
jgi:transposase-like protein